MQKACEYGRILKKLANILGILYEVPIKFLQFGFSKEQKNNIDNLIEKRSIAREQKDWQLADDIRDDLNTFDIVVEDGIDKTIWQRKVK